jgi:nitroreductase
MNKTADTDAPLITAIRERWSPRAFADRAVAPVDLRTLLEAARWAASCKNEQPWRFVYAHKGGPGYEALEALLDDFNTGWAAGAPVLMLSLAKKAFDGDGQPNAHAWHDVGLAMGQLLVQATSMGIYVHQMAGFDWRGANDALGIPEGFAPVAMAALGYPGDPDTLPEGLAKAERGPRKREALERLAFEGQWPQD